MASATVILLISELIIALYATGWVRSYLGDVLVVMLLYALARTIVLDHPKRWFVLPSIILLIAFCAEFLQLIEICNILNITNRILLTLMGSSFSVEDLLCYTVGSIPCYLVEYMIKRKRHFF